MSVRGIDAKLYYATDGVSGGTWVEAGNISADAINFTADEIEDTTRDNQGWKSFTTGLKDGTLEFTMNWLPSDAAFTAFKDAFDTPSHIGIRLLDQAGGEGFEADFRVSGFSWDRSKDGVQEVTVSARPYYVDTAPTFI